MSRANTKLCGICQTTFADSDCIHFPGLGTTDDPAIPEVVVAPTTANLIECSPTGLGAFLPPIYQDPPACNVIAEADQTIPYDVVWPLFYNEESYDTDDMHSDEDNLNRLVINTSGLYLVTLNVRWSKTNEDAATGDLAAYIRKNGSDFIASDSMPVPGGDTFGKQSVSVQWPFETGDYVESMVKHDVLIDGEGAALRITAVRGSPVFAATFIRPLRAMNVLGIPSSSSASEEEEFILTGHQWWETPDHSSLDITGDFDYRVAVALDDWTPALSALGAKNTGADTSFRPLVVLPSGLLRVLWNRGIVPDLFKDSTAAPSVSNGDLIALRVTLNVDNGAGGNDVKFYTKATTASTAHADCSADTGWTQLGSTVTTAGTTTVATNNQPFTVGAIADGSSPAVGAIYAAVLKDGINGSTVLDPDFYTNASPFVDSSGHTWTLQS